MSMRTFIVVAGLATLLACCSADDLNRLVYNSLRTHEQLQPGSDRQDVPTYDQYQASRSRPTTAD